MTRVLMVCLGNICRSPLAEGILKSKVNSSNIFVDSAGTGNYHIGGLPDKRSISVAEKYHLDISDQRCRQFSIQDFDKFDVIYVMDNSNRRDILSLARNEKDKVKIKMILNELFPDENVDSRIQSLLDALVQRKNTREQVRQIFWQVIVRFIE